MNPNINYEQLLKKYMAQVKNETGNIYISELNTKDDGEYFDFDEVDELFRIANDLDYL